MILTGELYSKVLEMDTGISIVSPSNYRIKGDLKVCYLLHGLMGNNTSWLNNTMLNVYADNYDMIFIMPEVQRSFYTDQKYGLDYFTYIVDELPIIVETMFNISKSREDTIIMGASMGGYGALKCALSRPDLYSECFAFSSGFLYLDEFLESFKKSKEDVNFRSIYGKRFLTDIEAIFGEDLIEDENDILLNIAGDLPIDNRPNINMYWGDRDYLREENIRFKNDLLELGYNIEYREFEGEHDWYFFDRALEKGLESYFNK